MAAKKKTTTTAKKTAKAKSKPAPVGARSQKHFAKALDKLLADGKLNATLAPALTNREMDRGDFRDSGKLWRTLRLPNGRCLESVSLWDLADRGTSEGLEGITDLRACMIGGDVDDVRDMLNNLRAVLPKLSFVELVGVSASLVPAFSALGDHGIHVICDLAYGERFEGKAPRNVEVFKMMGRAIDKTWLEKLLNSQ